MKYEFGNCRTSKKPLLPKKTILATMMCIAIGAPTVSFAQQQLEEIVVTAQKRSENVQDIVENIRIPSGAGEASGH